MTRANLFIAFLTLGLFSCQSPAYLECVGVRGASAGKWTFGLRPEQARRSS
jgi:hypothetical protein